MDKIKAAEERYPDDGSGSTQSKQQLAFIAGWDAALSTQSPKWVKASERRPGGNTKHICRDSDNPSIVKHLYWNEIPVYYEWLDESPPTTHPLQEKITDLLEINQGLREALERVLDYEDKWSIHDIAKQALETYK